MWKRPALPGARKRARRPRLSLLAALLLPALARAGELGEDVRFPFASASGFSVGQVPPGTIVFDSGESAWVAAAWDTLLFQGVSPDPQIAFEASRRDASGAWGPWTPASVSRHPGGRFWAKVSLRPAAPGRLRVRAIAGRVEGPHAVKLFTIEVFAAETPTSSSGRRAPAAPERLPELRERASWGARPPKQPWDSDDHYRLTLHHTSGHRPATLEESVREVFFIQDFHQNGRGWNDIAYHVLVDPEGRIFEGRPLGALGAHALHNNVGNVGVVFLGTYHEPDLDRPTPAQLAALVRVGRWLRSVYGVEPSTLKGHRDYKKTDCPGDILYPLLAGLREEMSRPAMTAVLPPAMLARPLWDGATARSPGR